MAYHHSQEDLSNQLWWGEIFEVDDQPHPELRERVPTGVYDGKKRHSEEADDYPNVICLLGDSWRVILCRHGIQWILQRWIGRRWRSQSYCRTRCALLGCIHEAEIEVDPDAASSLETLPEQI